MMIINQLVCAACKELGSFGLKENNGNKSKGFRKHIILECSVCQNRISGDTVPDEFNMQMLIASEMGPVKVINDKKLFIL